MKFTKSELKAIEKYLRHYKNKKSKTKKDERKKTYDIMVKRINRDIKKASQKKIDDKNDQINYEDYIEEESDSDVEVSDNDVESKNVKNKENKPNNNQTTKNNEGNNDFPFPEEDNNDGNEEEIERVLNEINDDLEYIECESDEDEEKHVTKKSKTNNNGDSTTRQINDEQVTYDDDDDDENEVDDGNDEEQEVLDDTDDEDEEEEEKPKRKRSSPVCKHCKLLIKGNHKFQRVCLHPIAVAQQ